MVIKKDGRREAFDRWKMKSGILKAIEKRPISLDQDEVAYVRFASVYRQFKDLNEFMHELKRMLSEPSQRSKVLGQDLQPNPDQNESAEDLNAAAKARAKTPSN